MTTPHKDDQSSAAAHTYNPQFGAHADEASFLTLWDEPGSVDPRGPVPKDINPNYANFHWDTKQWVDCRDHHPLGREHYIDDKRAVADMADYPRSRLLRVGAGEYASPQVPIRDIEITVNSGRKQSTAGPQTAGGESPSLRAQARKCSQRRVEFKPPF